MASLGAFERLQQADFIRAFWLLVLPQIPLSVGNAIIASEHTLRTYFPEQAKRVQASSLAFGMGCFNVLAGIYGGIPCCHDSGGVTAHYRLGARSGTATFFTGLFYCSLAIAVFYFGVSVFSFFPYPVLGVLLIYVGMEHGLLIHDISTRLDLATVLVIAAITITTRDMTIAFLVGMIFYQIARSQKISL